MSLTDSERHLLSGAGTTPSPTTRRQAVAVALAKSGAAREAAGDLLGRGFDGKGWSERPKALLDIVIATDGRTYSLSTLAHLLQIPEIAEQHAKPMTDTT